jgi:hypothetical protein
VGTGLGRGIRSRGDRDAAPSVRSRYDPEYGLALAFDARQARRREIAARLHEPGGPEAQVLVAQLWSLLSVDDCDLIDQILAEVGRVLFVDEQQPKLWRRIDHRVLQDQDHDPDERAWLLAHLDPAGSAVAPR